MKTKFAFAAAALIACAVWSPQCRADEKAATTPFERFTSTAQKAFDDGQYRRAESLWGKALNCCQESETKDQALATVLKRLGETMLKEGKYAEAEVSLRNANNLFQELSVSDAELAGDLALLAQTYRSVDTTQLGKFAQDVLTQANCSSMGVLKTDDGSKVTITFPARYSKHLDDAKDIDEVGVDRV
ncbi:MAG: tetratricopeptide repeat protein, partial [Terriglobales bacterium]